MIIIQDLTTIITGTGTTGDTTILGDGIITGSSNLLLVGISIITIIALLLDRRLNQKEDQYQEQYQELDQNQKKIEQE